MNPRYKFVAIKKMASDGKLKTVYSLETNWEYFVALKKIISRLRMKNQNQGLIFLLTWDSRKSSITRIHIFMNGIREFSLSGKGERESIHELIRWEEFDRMHNAIEAFLKDPLSYNCEEVWYDRHRS